jgi:CubicO group peptidase (beta-lactamase class C family)
MSMTAGAVSTRGALRNDTDANRRRHTVAPKRIPSFFAALACAIIAAFPASAGAGVTRCPSGKFDRGGTCTSFASAAKRVVSITRSVMSSEDGEGTILRVDIGNRTLVNRGLGLSMAGVPVTPEMNFRVGSMAIPALTTIALQLQDQRRLNLNDKLSRWYPNYPNADRVTLRMLASVTSGYPDFIQENPPFQKAQLENVFRQWTDDELLDYAFAQPIVCAPGSCFHYAHTNFVLLGRVLEKVTKQSTTQLMMNRIIRPLGLRDTRITKLPFIPSPVLHAYSDERGVHEDSTYWSPSWGLGNGELWTSTARDMIPFIRAIGTGKLISRSAFRQFTAPLSKGLPGAPSTAEYGLGIAIGNGWLIQNPVINGYAGILAYLPSQKIAVLIESTHGSKSTAQSIATDIFKAITPYLTPNNAFRT